MSARHTGDNNLLSMLGLLLVVIYQLHTISEKLTELCHLLNNKEPRERDPEGPPPGAPVPDRAAAQAPAPDRAAAQALAPVRGVHPRPRQRDAAARMLPPFLAPGAVPIAGYEGEYRAARRGRRAVCGGRSGPAGRGG
jgi:hypothetical protein